jgi:hypothetical protein
MWPAGLTARVRLRARQTSASFRSKSQARLLPSLASQHPYPHALVTLPAPRAPGSTLPGPASLAALLPGLESALDLDAPVHSVAAIPSSVWTHCSLVASTRKYPFCASAARRAHPPPLACVPPAAPPPANPPLPLLRAACDFLQLHSPPLLPAKPSSLLWVGSARNAMDLVEDVSASTPTPRLSPESVDSVVRAQQQGWFFSFCSSGALVAHDDDDDENGTCCASLSTARRLAARKERIFLPRLASLVRYSSPTSPGRDRRGSLSGSVTEPFVVQARRNRTNSLSRQGSNREPEVVRKLVMLGARDSGKVCWLNQAGPAATAAAAAAAAAGGGRLTCRTTVLGGSEIRRKAVWRHL